MDRDKSLVKLLIVPSVLFLHLAVSPKYVYSIIIALAFGFLGDIFLLWPEKKLCFGAGLFSFLAGHLCYIFTICIMTGSANVPPFAIILFVIPYLLYDL